MKKIIILFLLLISCSEKPGTVNISGKLQSIMMENKTEANIDLLDLRDKKHLYALGAIEGLLGEITIMDSDPFISKVTSDSFAIQNNFDAKATLLVYGQVEAWRSQPLEAFQNLKDLESIVKQVAEENHLEEPFPFLIKGSAIKLHWHIVNGNDPSRKTHQDHASSGYNSELNHGEVEILGFYSESHQGIFTHHGQNSHLHFQTTDGSKSGHVDELLMEGNSLLFIPKTH